MRIVILCPCNLNFGDNVILLTWLKFYDRFLCAEDTVTLLGLEIDSVRKYTGDLHYNIELNDSLHRRFFVECPQNAGGGWQPALEKLCGTVPEDSERVSEIRRIFLHAQWLHVLGGGHLTSRWPVVHYPILAAVRLTKQFGGKVIFTGHTIGPLNDSDKEKLRELFTNIDLLDLRDDACLTYLKENNSNVQVTLDDVFLATLSEKGEGLPANELCAEPHINLCFQKWEMPVLQQASYHAAIMETVRFLIRYHQLHPDTNIYFLEFAPHDHDMELGDEIIAALPDDVQKKCHRIALSGYYEGESIRLLQSAQLNLGTRFHMALFSLSAQPPVPTVSLILDDYYAHKLHGVHGQFHSANALCFEQYTAEAILEACEKRIESDSLPQIERQKRQKLESFFRTVAVTLPVPARWRLRVYLFQLEDRLKLRWFWGLLEKQWFFRKIKGGIQCYKDNGFLYTVKRLWQKVCKVCGQSERIK